MKNILKNNHNHIIGRDGEAIFNSGNISPESHVLPISISNRLNSVLYLLVCILEVHLAMKKVCI
jgi:hypothetical protein